MTEKNLKYKRIEEDFRWYNPKKESELKDIARDLADGKIFSDRHLWESNQYLFPSVFMVIALADQRFIDNMQHAEISFVYEYLKDSGPTAINGFPIFFTCRMLNKKDSEKMFKYYDKILEMKKKQQEEIDKLEV